MLTLSPVRSARIHGSWNLDLCMELHPTTESQNGWPNFRGMLHFLQAASSLPLPGSTHHTLLPWMAHGATEWVTWKLKSSGKEEWRMTKVGRPDVKLWSYISALGLRGPQASMRRSGPLPGAIHSAPAVCPSLKPTLPGFTLLIRTSSKGLWCFIRSSGI